VAKSAKQRLKIPRKNKLGKMGGDENRRPILLTILKNQYGILN